EVVLAVGAVERGAALVDHPRHERVTAEPNPGAARRLAGEILCVPELSRCHASTEPHAGSSAKTGAWGTMRFGSAELFPMSERRRRLSRESNACFLVIARAAKRALRVTRLTPLKSNLLGYSF